MKTVFSYLRLIIASCMFMGGLALVLGPSAAEAQRENRWRDHNWHRMAEQERREQERLRDEEQAGLETSLRILGVFLGGLGFAVALHETAFVLSRYLQTRD